MQIPVDNKSFGSVDEAVKYLMDSRGFSNATASSIVSKIESNIKSKGAGNIPRFTEDETGRYATFFLLNDQWNEMDWRVTAASLPEYIHTFEGMPYISEPKLEHFGMGGNDPVSQTLVTQEKFRAGDIIKARMAGIDTSEVVVKFDDTPNGNKAWTEMKNGEGIYVSPAVVGIANYDPFGRITYDTWHGLHLARVANPAYGVAVASIKQTCEGPKSTCINNLFRNAVASGKIKNDSFNIGNSTSNHMTDKTVEELTKELVAATASIETQKAEITKLSKDLELSVASKKSSGAADCEDGHMVDGECVKNAAAAEDCEDGEMIDGECVKKAVASVKDPVAKKLIETLITKVAANEKKEKEELASSLAEFRIEAKTASKEQHKELVEGFMKMSVASLKQTYQNEVPLLEKIISMSGSKPGMTKTTLVHIPESSSTASNSTSITSLEDMQRYL